MFLTLGAKPCAIFDHFNLSRANIFGCKRVTLSHLGCGSRPGKPGEDPENRPERLSTFDPFPDRPGPSRSEHYYGVATGGPWTLGAQTSVNSSILLSQKIDEMGRGNASLSTIDPFLLSNKLLFILHLELELQKQCVSLTRRIFNTINNFSYTAYHRFCPRVILFLWSIQPFCRCNILFFAPVSQFLPLFLDFLPPFYLSCRFSSHLAPALF